MEKIPFNEELVVEVYKALAHSISTEIRTIHPKYPGAKHICVMDENTFVQKVANNNGKSQVYVGINERIINGTEIRDVVSLSNIVIDIDAIRSKGYKQEAATDEELVKAKIVADKVSAYLVSIGFKKPIMCLSGNGYSLWQFIRKIPITDSNRDDMNRRNKQYQRELIDKFSDGINANIDQVGDLSRIIRVPGTLNIKSSTRNVGFRESKCLEPHFVRDEDEKLREYILTLKMPEINRESRPILDHERKLSPDQMSRRDELVKSDKKMQALLGGSVSGYQSRSEAEMALIYKLILYGFSKGEVFQIMDKCKIGKWIESPDSYRILTYGKATAKVQKGAHLRRERDPYAKAFHQPKFVER